MEPGPPGTSLLSHLETLQRSPWWQPAAPPHPEPSVISALKATWCGVLLVSKRCPRLQLWVSPGPEVHTASGLQALGLCLKLFLATPAALLRSSCGNPRSRAVSVVRAPEGTVGPGLSCLLAQHPPQLWAPLASPASHPASGLAPSAPPPAPASPLAGP